MKIFLSSALFCALALPTLAQTTPPIPRASASLGSFYPGASTNDRHSQTNFVYWPKLTKTGLLSHASAYLDTNRHRTGSVVGTTTTTRTSAMQGLGLCWRSNFTKPESDGLYNTGGFGLYEKRLSTTAVTGAGSAATTVVTHSRGVSLGGKLGIGYQKDSVFVEAEYSVIGRIRGTDPSGLGVRFGVRL